MQPRLKTSRKWTPLPEELIKQIQSVFKQNFSANIGNNTVEAGGGIYPEEILVTVGIRAPKTLRQSNFEVSIGYKKEKDNVLKLLHLAMDAMGALFEQFFAAEDDQEFPRIWQEVDFEGRKIYVQYSTANTELEAEADKLLGVKPGTLTQGEWDEELTPEQIKAQLGIDPEDEHLIDDLLASDEEDAPPKKKGH